MLRLVPLAAAFLLVPAPPAGAEVQTKEVSYKQAETELSGFFAWDAQAKRKQPGVIVVHEWWGHNAHARNQAIPRPGFSRREVSSTMPGSEEVRE